MARRRYQKGRLILRGKANPVWVGRWREDVIGADGVTRRIERSETLGTKEEVPTQRLALRRLEVLLARANAPDYRPGRITTLAQFAERWKETVLSQHKPSSQKAALSNLRCHVLPQLGNDGRDANTPFGKPEHQVFPQVRLTVALWQGPKRAARAREDRDFLFVLEDEVGWLGAGFEIKMHA